MNPFIQKNLEEIKKSALVLDIETASFKDGREVNIRTDFDDYIKNAKVKWFGAYSYRDNKTYLLNPQKDSSLILQLLREHNIFIGFNCDEFDLPILVNNGFIDIDRKYLSVDCKVVLGTIKERTRDGYSYKNRAELMNVKLKNNHLRGMAESFNLETQKGNIDYKIFFQNQWSEEETEEIKRYLEGDILATKQLFDKLWDFWFPFTEFLDENSIYNLSWIRSSIASLTYKAACHVYGVTPTYSEIKSSKEEMGGRVIEPKYEEMKGVWYVDFASLYPHIFSMFNLFSEVNPELYPDAWHGNEMFEVKGYYDISSWNLLSKEVSKRLEERIKLKETDKNNPMAYALKIFCNCFSDDTSVVMADGTIKKIQDCNVGERVYSINPKTLMLEKKEIIKTFKYNYNGDMHHYTGHYFDFNVTPNHKFLLQHKKNKKDVSFYESYEIESQHKLPIHKHTKKIYKNKIDILDYLSKENYKYSIDLNNIHGRTWLCKYGLKNVQKKYNCNDRNFIYEYSDISFKLSAILNNKYTTVYLKSNVQPQSDKIPHKFDNKALSYIIGIYLAEGSTSHLQPRHYNNRNYRGNTYSINIAQDKEINPLVYKKITDALDLCNLKYSAGKHCIKISGKVFYDFIIENFGNLKNKHIKKERLWNELNLKKVFEGLIDGDGTKKSNLFTTKYNCLRNDFINLCVNLGYTFTIKNDGCWRIIYNNSANSFRKVNRTINKYNGNVYCLEIKDNHTLLAGRNGKFNWSGNSLYGVARSALFERVHTPNCGWDCCWIGQQIHKFTEEKMTEFGFETILGDTDSIFIKATNEKYNTKEYVKTCLEYIVKQIKDNAPFPVKTFNIKIEDYLDYIMCPFSEQPIQDENGNNIKKGNRLVKVRKGRKKNYLYICGDKIKLVGLPIMKDNSSPLSMKIYEEVLKPLILKNKSAKFDKEFIQKNINEYLAKEEVMELMAREYKVNKASSYKLDSQIQAQISANYFSGESGTIKLIKNNKIGKVGKGQLYCTIKEALSNSLTADDLDLEKVYNELEPFIKHKAT